MSVNWQNKILDFDIPPPPNVWNNIADQLDEEFKTPEIMLSQKLYDYEINPPSFILENVITVINAVENKPITKVPLFTVRRISVAAVTIGLLALTLIYLLNEGSSSAKKSAGVTTTLQVTPGAGSVLTPGNDSKKIIPSKSGLSNPEASLASIVPNKKNYSNSRKTRIERNTGHVGLNPLLAVNAISAISVSAPPIYDLDGNIIMDESLVSAPDDNYIIVTSPNGKQTKISRKFLKMLSVLNGGTSTNYVNPENFQWQMRFDEWRSKLLRQASYIPTANNFLDIMDLKEMLQEN